MYNNGPICHCPQWQKAIFNCLPTPSQIINLILITYSFIDGVIIFSWPVLLILPFWPLTWLQHGLTIMRQVDGTAWLGLTIATHRSTLHNIQFHRLAVLILFQLVSIYIGHLWSNNQVIWMGSWSKFTGAITGHLRIIKLSIASMVHGCYRVECEVCQNISGGFILINSLSMEEHTSKLWQFFQEEQRGNVAYPVWNSHVCFLEVWIDMSVCKFIGGEVLLKFVSAVHGRLVVISGVVEGTIHALAVINNYQ